MKYSIIIPVYNRPQEVEELLESLCAQVYQNFEVIIVEDGSSETCQTVVEAFAERLDIRYYYKENSGQGFSRNYGFERAKGDYFIVFDSDCIVPPHYLESVQTALLQQKLDAYGGPDRAHHSFSNMQKAISYAMTSVYSTGGIRGGKKAAERFRPRSFNMGISREVYEQTKGYKITRMGEDIELSIRIEREHYFKVGLIPAAYVYHKRRTDFRQFYKQLHFFGRARINVSRFFPQELKLVHTFPALFVVFLLLILPMFFLSRALFWAQLAALGLYTMLLFSDALAQTRSLQISLLGVAAVFVQLTAYGIGFLSELGRKLRGA